MSSKSSGYRELAELVSDHIFGDEHFIEDFTIVHEEGVPDKLRYDGTSARPGFDRVSAAVVLLVHDLFEDFFVNERSFF